MGIGSPAPSFFVDAFVFDAKRLLVVIRHGKIEQVRRRVAQLKTMTAVILDREDIG
jgi:hypothetical protein